MTHANRMMHASRPSLATPFKAHERSGANKAYDTNPEIIKVVDAVYIPAAKSQSPMYHVPLLALAPTQVANISQFDIVRLSVEIASTWPNCFSIFPSLHPGIR